MDARLAAAFVAFAVLAGCSDGGEKGGTDVELAGGQTVELPRVDNSLTRGSISGVIVDEAIRPLAGSNLTLLGPQTTATADKDGLFIFEGLEPGLYTLAASGTGYLPAQTTVGVKAGETAKVRMVLAVDSTPRPYHTTLKFEGYVEASFGALNQGWQLVVKEYTGVDICQCQFYYQTDGPPATQIVEVTWERSLDNPAMPTDGYWAIWDDDSSDYYDDGCGNPCYGRVDGGFSKNATNFHTDFWMDYYWVQYQQRFTEYVTLFYVEQAPEGWSFVAGNV